MSVIKKAGLSALLFLWLISGLAWSESQIDQSEKIKVAIVVDDLGHSLKLGRQSVNLPAPVTLSFLPNRVYTNTLIKYARNKPHEIMLHLPMENLSGFPLGELGLTLAMDDQERLNVLNQALDSVPGAIGLNNHMGSALTRDRASMDWLMNQLYDRGMYFLDSITVTGSVGWKAAEDRGLPFVKRQIFLDNHKEPEYLDKQFEHAMRIARKIGEVVIITHPDKESLNFLEMRIPLAIKYENVEFVLASELAQNSLGQGVVEFRSMHQNNGLISQAGQ